MSHYNPHSSHSCLQIFALGTRYLQAVHIVAANFNLILHKYKMQIQLKGDLLPEAIFTG